MTIAFQLGQFSGPLDLLLSLLSEERLSINDVSLSAVTEQYLRYLDSLEERNADELADFLVVAAKLLLLKSKTLLPNFLPEEEDGGSLEAQLKLYKQFVDASKKVHKLWLSPWRSIGRERTVKKPDGFVPPSNVTAERLVMAMKSIVNRLAPPKPLPQTHIDKSISLKEKIDAIRRLVSSGQRLLFHEILESSQNKTEIIVSFLAILELMKQQQIFLEQSDSFSDIMILPV